MGRAGAEARRTAPELGELLVRARAAVASRPGLREHDVSGEGPAGLARRTGLEPRGSAAAAVILARDSAVELGHPATPSVSTVLTTFRPGLVRNGRVLHLGPDLDEALAPGPGPARLPLAQLVLVELAPGARLPPSDLEALSHLVGRLPGAMARSVPGRLWIRVSRAGLERGLRAATLGEALVAAFSGELEAVRAVEVVLVTGPEAEVRALEPIALAARALSGRHERLFLGPAGELECWEGSCESCRDRVVCERARALLAGPEGA